jgi:hypothetical protein
MSDATGTTDDLGPMPEPEIEPGEPNPGGVDAVPLDQRSEPLPRDSDPSENPATGEIVPDAVRSTEDTSTEATTSDEAPATDGQSDEKESPA